jgi:hypothetical protein
MKKLLTVSEVTDKIINNERLVLAGDEQLLSQLPKGEWIGGTIPYFMAEDGGTFSKDKIFVDEIPGFALNTSIKNYDEKSLFNIVDDEFESGYTLIIIPGFSSVHTSFAENSHLYKNIFQRPLLGWISGIDLSEIDKTTPKVFNGKTGEKSDTLAVAIHIELPPNKVPILDIINLFEQGNGDTITFETNGFNISDCLVNGERKYLSDYLLENETGIKLPLVADYYGAKINACFQSIDADKRIIKLYAPVFKDVKYKIAAPIGDYVKEFTERVSKLNISPVFTCNCILNYLYSELEGKRTANITGPITFGEIAYQLLNQTLVYLTIKDI